jgi:hypothetical protein
LGCFFPELLSSACFFENYERSPKFWAAFFQQISFYIHTFWQIMARVLHFEHFFFWSATPCASPPAWPSIFSDYSFWVHHLFNQYDWHLLAHAISTDFSTARQCLSKRTNVFFCYGSNSTPLFWAIFSQTHLVALLVCEDNERQTSVLNLAFRRLFRNRRKNLKHKTSSRVDVLRSLISAIIFYFLGSML